MAERFSYYGMRALFVLYLVAAFYDNASASRLYGSFTALVYLTPLLGGYVADRYWGHRRSIIAGGMMMAAGQFLMFASAATVRQAIPEAGAAVDTAVDNTASLALLFAGLTALIIGNGFFKPNISTMVGDLYAAGDARRDAAFTIFYMGINLGALLAPFVCGTLGNGTWADPAAFRWGFFAAGVAMLLSVAVFVALKSRYLHTPDGQPVGCQPLARRQQGTRTEPLTAVEWQRIAVIFVIAVFVIFFWAAFEQAGCSLTLIADQQCDRHIGAWEVPTTWFQSINPIVVVTFAPVMATLWSMLARRGHEPSSPVKQAIGLALLAAGYLVIALAVSGDTTQKMSMWWLVVLYFVHTIGELSLSPIGLSMVTRLAPHHLAALFMGIWFTSNAVSNWLAGMLATLLPEPGQAPHMFLGVPIATLTDFFLLFAVMAGAAAVILFALCPTLKRLAHGAL